MGRTNFSITASGMTVEEARRNAHAADREENGHQDGYSGSFGSAVGSVTVVCVKAPIPAKKAKVKRLPQTGARKWVTKYVAEPRWMRDRDVCGRLPEANTLGECIKLARDFSQRHNISMVVEVTKRLQAGNARCAEIEPVSGVAGSWKFSGEARE